ncbi:DUF58 domain-containing protein [Dactylosporangium sp. AC04546]|uniref:DUF58 domain-containing protein n=1 Tax=Dactylosporangium sp. AC04546 TaxID=2862460 RepID=UPI001EDEB7D8|nr:DUF58 domain-containing protein [Dactylosporangium sp. AC04546]WVK87328.1 DUF58 domain-containing protein [Dactylosporangium sp. AC04546]
MRLTRRGVTVLSGAAGCYLVGELAGYAYFRVLAGILVGCLLAAAATTMLRPAVQISRTVYPDRIERGRPALATLLVRNTTAHRHRGFAAGDRAGAEVHEIRIRPIPPGADATYHYELPTALRGRLQVGPLALRLFDPLELVRTERTVGSTASVWVYPRRHPARPAQVGHPRHHHDGPITDPPLRGSADMRAVREYVPGDEVRHLHWKATARTGQLMVRDYADPARTRLTVLLDTRSAAMTPTVFEEAVEVAASLLYASAAAGQQCRLVTPAGTDTPVDSGLRVARVLLDELCLVGQDDAPPGPPPPATARPPGALVVITGPDADLGPARRWRPDTVIRLGVTAPAAGGFINEVDAAAAVAKWNALRAGPA